MPSPFDQYRAKAWPFHYMCDLTIRQVCGGVPANPNTAASWIQSKTKDTRSDKEVQALVEQTKAEILATHLAAGRVMREEEATGELVAVEVSIEPLTEDELLAKAIEKTAKDMAGLNMFKRTPTKEDAVLLGLPFEHPAGVLYIEGRQVKAGIKEAAAVAANAGKISTKNWGNPDNAAYKKQLKGWLPEHVFVPQTEILLSRDGAPVTEPDGIIQKFVHTHRGDAIAYEEYVRNAEITFRVLTDVELTEEQWAMIMLTGELQGLGASRSQGFGTYTVTGWERVKAA